MTTTAVTGQQTEQQITEVTQGMAGVKIDRQAGLIRGVKVLGAKSRNGRTYAESAMQGAVALYEGVKVNVNHPATHSSLSPQRTYEDRLGKLQNVRRRADGLYGDLRFNPKHRLAEQLIWDAENEPGNVGLSHNINGVTRRDPQSGETVVEEIRAVLSVDLVADPATTNGLFESVQMLSTKPRPSNAGMKRMKTLAVRLTETYKKTAKRAMRTLLEVESIDGGDVLSQDVADDADPVQAVQDALALEAMKIFKDDSLDPKEKGRRIAELAKAVEDVAKKLAGNEPAAESQPSEDEAATGEEGASESVWYGRGAAGGRLLYEEREASHAIRGGVEELREEVRRLKAQQSALGLIRKQKLMLSPEGEQKLAKTLAALPSSAARRDLIESFAESELNYRGRPQSVSRQAYVGDYGYGESIKKTAKETAARLLVD